MEWGRQLSGINSYTLKIAPEIGAILMFLRAKKSSIGFYVMGVSFLYLAFRGQKLRYRALRAPFSW